MPPQLFKEMLNGKYDGVTSPLLLPVGAICDGKNMRKVSPVGGWKARKGCVHNNTTTIGAHSFLSLHQYIHPRSADYHFLGQINSKLYDATNDPPAAGTTFGADITSGTTVHATQPGFSDMIQERFVYADGNKPLQWGGDTPMCTGFSVYDNGTTSYVDYTRIVTDNRTATEAICVAAASDTWYVCSPEIAESLTFDLGATVNSTAARTLTLKSWVSGAWDDRSATDNTKSGTTTMAQDGTVTWTKNTTDTMSVINGIMGYWYQITFNDALSNSVDVIGIKVTYDLATMTNKWDGVYEFPLSVVFFDVSVGGGTWEDLTGKMTNESTAQSFNLDAAAIGDYIYVKAVEPLTGIGFGIEDGYANDAGGGNVDLIEYWTGAAWTTVGTLTDETLNIDNTESFATTGMIWWNGTAYTAARRTMDFDQIPGYWYRVSWDAAPDNTADDIRWYMTTVVPFAEALSEYDGVVEFKSRTLLWGDPEYPNRLRFSAKDKPDVLSGSDSGYTDTFGNMTKLVQAVRFYNELVVFKADSVWLMEGFSGATFGNTRIADTVGCCAPKTIQVIETGWPTAHADEPLSIIIWMDTDGVYVLDGRKPRKVSGPIDHYFNTEYTTAIAAAYLDDAQAFVDPLRNEYHLLLSNEGTGHGTELVYNYVTDEWYPAWDRTVGGANDFLVCGISLRGTDNRYYTYGGTNAGFVLRLENDTTDKNASAADVAITHNVKTRAVSFTQKQSVTMRFVFRQVQIEAKARSSGTVATNFYKDLATSGTTLDNPAAISLVNTGYDLVVDGLETSQENCKCFQVRLQAATADVELEIYSYLYVVDLEAEIGIQ